MDFQLSEKQQMIKKNAREYTEKFLAPGVLERDETSTYPIEAFHKLGELGFIGLPYPSEYGGSDGGYLDYVMSVEEVSKVDGSMGISYSVSTSLYAGPIFMFGSEEQKKKYLPPVLSGKSLGSFCLTEPNAGSDAAGVVTKAVKEGDHYVLNGLKCFITNGPLSDYFFVVASTNPELGTRGLSAFIVEKAFPGVEIGKIENKMGVI